MKPRNSLYLLGAASAITMLLAAGGCANIGTPSGGPRDETPPRLVKASPAPGSLGVDKRKITLEFDELVSVRDAFQKVVVSPTSAGMPRVTSLGRRVQVEFDSLSPNTTYTIDFGDAIEDNNENNKLQGFTYTFSTGPSLDTLRISGRVLGALNLEPQQGMLVGVHANLADSAFTSQRLLRVAKTDDRGQFTIRGLAPGKYRVFALGDKDNDMRYSSPEEDIAFYEMVVEPSARTSVATDSIWNPLTGLLDSVRYRERTQYLPNDLLLRTFNSDIRSQYLTKYERLDSTRIFLKFNRASAELPSLRVPGMPALKSIGTLEASSGLDSLVYWLRPELVGRDSLMIEATYYRADAGATPTLTVDTLAFNYRRSSAKAKKSDRKRRISAADSIAAITMAFSPISGAQQDVHKPVYFESKTPLKSFDLSAVHLSLKKDSLFIPITEGWSVSMPDSLQPRRFMVEYPWEYGASYRIDIDSLAARSILGLPSRPFSHSFTVKEAGEYSSLIFHIKGIPNGVPAFVELLNASDTPVRVEPVEDSQASFLFLEPGKYYARIIFDADDNGRFTTGLYSQLRQPEEAYYYPKAINIKKFWNKEESWDIFATPVDKMKPEAILKNKPASDTRRRSNSPTKRTEEDEEDL